MVKVSFVQLDGAAVTVEADLGKSAMEAAIFNHVRGIAAECGGLCSCATCHVYLDPAWADRLPSPAADEDDMLGFTAAPRLPDKPACLPAASSRGARWPAIGLAADPVLSLKYAASKALKSARTRRILWLYSGPCSQGQTSS